MSVTGPSVSDPTQTTTRRTHPTQAPPDTAFVNIGNLSSVSPSSLIPGKRANNNSPAPVHSSSLPPLSSRMHHTSTNLWSSLSSHRHRPRLAVLAALVGLLVVLWLLFAHHGDSRSSYSYFRGVATDPLRGSSFDYYSRDASLVTNNKLYANTTHLVLVAGHSVFLGGNWDEWSNPANWAFEAFQRRDHTGDVLVNTYNQHIRRGVEILTGMKSLKGCRQDSGVAVGAAVANGQTVAQRRRDLQTRLLMFSGGASRQQSGPRSEALSYYQLAEHNHFYGLFGERYTLPPPSSDSRSNPDTLTIDENDYTEHADAIVDGTSFAKRFVSVEEFARDSYENLLFSVYRFREVTGRFPAKITVVGYEYKRQRFVDVHRVAMRIPASMFEYVGIDSFEAEMLLKSHGIHTSRDIPTSVLDAYATVFNLTLAMPDSFTQWLHPTPDCAQSLIPSSERFATKKKSEKQLRTSTTASDSSPRGGDEEASPPLPWVYRMSDEATLNYVKKDPYLCTANEGVRRVRNPTRRVPPYLLSAPRGAPRGLLAWCGPGTFPERLPWEH